MTPMGDETKQEMRAVVREEVEDAAAGAAERIARERHSTQIGWALFALAGFILAANVAADLLERQRPSFSPAVVMLVILLAFGGGALVQGVRLDKILTAWKGGKDDAA